MSFNVLKDFPYSKRYYLTHPWKWFEEIWLNLRAAYQRVTKGYCYTDVWNMDDWFLTIFPNMLRELADKHCAYPGVEPFETPEKWEAWLRDMASKLEYCGRDIDEDNEYYEAYFKSYDMRAIMTPSTDQIISIPTVSEEERKELFKKYSARSQELTNEEQKVLEETMAELGRHFRNLWD